MKDFSGQSAWVLEHFDFPAAVKYLVDIKAVWGAKGAPSVDDLREVAERLVKRIGCAGRLSGVPCKGYEAGFCAYWRDGKLGLWFGHPPNKPVISLEYSEGQ